MLKPGYPVGTLDLKTDKAGNLWIGMMYQSGVARFDKKTETFKTWAIPKEWQTDAAQSGHLDPTSAHLDGKVWVKNSDGSQIMRLDPETGQWENLGSFNDPSSGKRLGVYGIRGRPRQQSLSARLPVVEHRPYRGQDRPVHGLSRPDRQLAPAPRRRR